MSAPVVMVPVLGMDNTVARSRLGHRLAMGLQCVDACTELPVEPLLGQAVGVDLRALDERAWVQRLEPHTQARHAMRWAGRYKAWLERAVAQGDSAAHELWAYGSRDARAAGYDLGLEPRRYVPRRLALTPVLAAGQPVTTPANVRSAWLWPGAAYPLASRATALRGRIRRDLGAGQHAAVPWARVVCTKAGAGAPNFATEARIGWAHGDDRGEFLLVLGANTVSSGGALPQQVPVHVWVFLPPAVPAFDPANPMLSLPLEDGGTQAINDVLKGRAIPAAYVPQSVRSLTVKLGEVRVMNEADLLF